MNIYSPNNLFKFYVYAYLREDGTPYYIGKGSGNRITAKHKNEVRPPKNKNNIIILEKNLSNIGALAIERRMIQWYGRIDLQTGILRNKTDGGEGSTGNKHSEKTKKKLSDLATGRQLNEETKKKISQKLIGKRRPRTEQHQKNLTEALLGKCRAWNKGLQLTDEKYKIGGRKNKGKKPWLGLTHSEKSKHQMSEKAKSREKKICPHCGKISDISNYTRWHGANCRHK